MNKPTFPKQIKFTLGIITLLVIVSCKIDNVNIIDLLGAKQSYKPVTSNEYVYGSGFCTHSLWLNSDSTFQNESGCEGRSHITIGTWKFVNDSIKLTTIDNSKLAFVANVELSKGNESLQTTFQFSDKKGAPIKNFVILPINNHTQYRLTSNPGIIIGTSGIRIYCPKTNADGIIQIEKSKFDTLAFPQLEIIAKKKFRLPSKVLPDTIKINLDLIDFDFALTEISYDYWDKPINFKRNRDKLVNSDCELKLRQ